jgi:hypothetical protein
MRLRLAHRPHPVAAQDGHLKKRVDGRGPDRAAIALRIDWRAVARFSDAWCLSVSYSTEDGSNQAPGVARVSLDLLPRNLFIHHR